MDVPFDLSKVLFIATANQASSIPGPLRDRMEVIEVSSYTLNEKVEIAKQYIIPEQLEEHGLSNDAVSFPDEGLRFLIESYTRESVFEVSNERLVPFVEMKTDVVMEQSPQHPEMNPKAIDSIRGPIKFFNDVAERDGVPGVVTRLASTAVGGDIFIEAAKMPGKGGLKPSGSLGDVMKESSSVALSFLRSIANQIGIDSSVLEESDIHIHVPSGATQKTDHRQVSRC